MQSYIDQFYDLYEDFHLVKSPLLADEVRGVEAIRSFSQHLIKPFSPPAPAHSNDPKVAALEREVARLREENEKLKGRLGM